MRRLTECGRGRIVKVMSDTPEGRRLVEMGAVPGAAVRIVRRAPLGDPVQIALRGFTMTVRRDTADGIFVDGGEEDGDHRMPRG